MDRRTFLTSAGTGLISSSAFAGDWNQWRGPTRNGLADDDFVWPANLSDASLDLAWAATLGPSYSGPIVVGETVYTTETIGKKVERATAFKKTTGEKIWSAEWEGAMKVPFFAAANGSWIRATPAATQDYLLVGGIRDVLVCLDAATGAEVWRQDFVKSLSTSLPTFGFVSSPLIRDGHVYVQAGGGLLKLKLETGEIVWRTLDDGGGMNGSAFSSPVIREVSGQSQLLVQTRQELVGVDLEQGEKLWSVKVPAFRGMNILTPTVFAGNKLFTSTYRNGSFAYRVSNNGGQWKVTEEWRNNIQGYMSSPLVFDDHVYLHLANGRLTCMHLDTGEQKWSSRPHGKYWSSIAQNDRMLALDERGDLLLVAPNPEQFKLLGKKKVADNSWAHLAVANDLVFIRDLERLSVYRWV